MWTSHSHSFSTILMVKHLPSSGSIALSLARTLEHQGLRNSPAEAPNKWVRLFHMAVTCWDCWDMICAYMCEYLKMIQDACSRTLAYSPGKNKHWIPTCAEVSNRDARSTLGASCAMLAPVLSFAAAHLMGFRYEVSYIWRQARTLKSYGYTNSKEMMTNTCHVDGC